MEKGIRFDWESYMWEMFEMKEVDINSYSPLTLAYIGDSVFDLIIKSLVINEGNKQVRKFHQETSFLVQASAQSQLMRVIQDELTNEELAVYKRGRNTKSVTPAKNQSITDYRRATGFEALIGYLYLNRDWKRILDLVKMGLDKMEENKDDRPNDRTTGN